MYRKYSKYLAFLLLACLFTACETASKAPTHSIQIEIQEVISKEEKQRAIKNIQRRLESHGAENVVITEQEDQKITFNYAGNVKPKTLDKGFSVRGKLEFFEVCLEKEILHKYLLKTEDRMASNNHLNDKENGKHANTDALFGISFLHSSGPVFGVITVENVEKIQPLLKKEPFYLEGKKKYIKFLLGKKDHKINYDIYVVYVNKDGSPALDGSYVVDATAKKASYHDGYVITLQMDDEGAKIWEQITQHAYETRGNIAVVMDDEVYVAPSVSTGGITGGLTEMAGNFTREEATILANAIRLGSIPKMEIIKVESLLSY
ncbi:bifunctional preprotein translocase subunit SecD/SecF [Kordia sp. SMS9]|uniref:SecDF P1 head subdomain-containing protein n=1 Tax=Kordia sp. SMS9 TaxID=2282170 RepID=UPI000E0D50D4|nr:hypothetical protein [Kordia sp. SMS9]AXG72310.1 bifunctional preprotein translocase subunit SecD/SecF [Kordia sp. SMS9]